MTTFAHDLACAQDRLEQLATGDLATAAAFTMSYRTLPPARQRLFRLLGLSPGADTDVYAATALTGAPLSVVQRDLEALYDDHLIDSPTPGRYRLHDLLRMYARDLAETDPAAERTAAVDRLLDYYGLTAAAARHRATGCQDPLPLGSQPLSTLPQHATRQRAVQWMRTEHANLRACVLYAAETHRHTHLVRLTESIADYLYDSGHWDEGARRHEIAVRSAHEAHDPRATATAQYHLGRIRAATGHYEQAASLLRSSAQLAGAETPSVQAVPCAHWDRCISPPVITPKRRVTCAKH
ncbi:hypothetical protein AB0H77_27940 [Streptomyces sp. NPDC050844]|uniref:hypothetical protein n=1 Tax=Streptomyces sp. NPDC050844 TaxID=3155790 RepID=UPI0033DCEB7E